MRAGKHALAARGPAAQVLRDALSRTGCFQDGGESGKFYCPSGGRGFCGL